eukprot:1133584-Pelagomonas_calceolata.AAC.1
MCDACAVCMAARGLSPSQVLAPAFFKWKESFVSDNSEQGFLEAGGGFCVRPAAPLLPHN